MLGINNAKRNRNLIPENPSTMNPFTVEKHLC